MSSYLEVEARAAYPTFILSLIIFKVDGSQRLASERVLSMF